LGEEDRITLDQIQTRLNSNEEVIKVMNGNNTEDVKKEHFNKVYGKRPQIELYDLRNDPAEMQNLADDPAHQTIRKQLEQRLLAELKRTDDPRLVDNGRFYETPPMAGPPYPDDPAAGRQKKR